MRALQLTAHYEGASKEARGLITDVVLVAFQEHTAGGNG
jgi:hypothetical protein